MEMVVGFILLLFLLLSIPTKISWTAAGLSPGGGRLPNAHGHDDAYFALQEYSFQFFKEPSSNSISGFLALGIRHPSEAQQ